MTTSVRLCLVALLVALLPLLTFAAEFRAEDQPTLSAGQTINDDLYMAGGNVTSAGSVRGDLLIAGGNLLVSGPVSGDLMAGGGSITILGNIGDDVRIGGGNITIQGSVKGDVVVGGGQVTLSGSGVGGDVAIAAGSINITAPVGGDLKVGGGQVYIDAPITGNVEIQAEKVSLGPRAEIKGDFSYAAVEEAEVAPGAVVRGKTTYAPQENVRDAAKAGAAAFFSFWLLAKFLMSLVGALALGYLLHRFSRELVATVATQPLLEIGRGLIAVIVLPIISIILLITVIGIPLGALGLISYVALLVFACIAAPVVTGAIVHKWIWKPAGYIVDWKTILLGVVIYFVLGLIPIVGWIITFAVMLTTLGASLNIKWNAVKEWR